jgi:tetratricopeptide (TPR) repeat protein
MIEWLSGKVPGGLPLLFFIFVSSNLAIYYLYKYSRLYSKSSYLQKVRRINGTVFSVYIILWILLRPPTPPAGLIFLPFQVEDSMNCGYSEALEQFIGCKSIKDYYLHPWNRFYKTADRDSVNSQDYRLNLARKMGVDMVLAGSLKGGNLELQLFRAGEQIAVKRKQMDSITFKDVAVFALEMLKKELKIENPNSLCAQDMDDQAIITLTKAKMALEDDSYRKITWYVGERELPFDIIRAEIFLKQGIKFANEILRSKKRRSSSLQLSDKNQFFSEARSLLKPYQERNEDTSEMNRILGEIYMYELKYEYAEYLLKKALMQNPSNARVYYLLSLLHISRLEDMGYENRIAPLEQAVYFDPGFAEAVLDLAREYYYSGTASPGNFYTMKARQLLENYLAFAGKDVPALGFLAKITLHSEQYDSAIALFEHMAQLGADKAEIKYNLGICYYGMHDYQRAVEYFKQAIAINDYTDAYLYLGMIYKNKLDFEQALFYLRERIKRKSGDDDIYAREAMLGVRIILDKIAKAEEEGVIK